MEDPVSALVSSSVDAGAKIVDVGVKIGEKVIDSVALTAAAVASVQRLLAGNLREGDFEITDKQDPTERALRAFRQALRGKLLVSQGRIGASISQSDNTATIVSTSGLIVTALHVSESSDQSEEVRGWGESSVYTFYITLRETLALQLELSSEEWRWERVQAPDAWWFRVTIRKRPSRIEAILPTPGKTTIQNGIPLNGIERSQVPRVSNQKTLEMELKSLSAVETPVYLKALFDSGNADAGYLLGTILFANNPSALTHSLAANTMEQAAKIGSGAAAWHLGDRYLEGDGVQKDEAKAALLFKLALNDASSFKASARLARLKMIGLGVPVSYEEGEKALLELCSRYPMASFPRLEMALALADRRCPKSDAAKSLVFLDAAAHMGNQVAMALVARCYLLTMDEKSSLERVFYLYNRAIHAMPSPRVISEKDKERLTREADIVNKIRLSLPADPKEYYALWTNQNQLRVVRENIIRELKTADCVPYRWDWLNNRELSLLTIPEKPDSIDDTDAQLTLKALGWQRATRQSDGTMLSLMSLDCAGRKEWILGEEVSLTEVIFDTTRPCDGVRQDLAGAILEADEELWGKDRRALLQSAIKVVSYQSDRYLGDPKELDFGISEHFKRYRVIEGASISFKHTTHSFRRAAYITHSRSGEGIYSGFVWEPISGKAVRLVMGTVHKDSLQGALTLKKAMDHLCEATDLGAVLKY